MTEFLRDARVDAAVARIFAIPGNILGVSESCDADCSTEEESDGITGFDVFGCGFDLAIQAQGRPVVVSLHEDAPDISPGAYFFIGTVDEVLAKLAVEEARLVAENEGSQQ